MTDLSFSESINFTAENYRLLANGSKKTTIRLGYKAYLVGKISITADYAQIGVSADVTEVRHIRFGDLGLMDAVNDGFNSIEALRRELQKCYQTLIADYDIVTVVRLDRVDFDD